MSGDFPRQPEQSERVVRHLLNGDDRLARHAPHLNKSVRLKMAYASVRVALCTYGVRGLVNLLRLFQDKEDRPGSGFRHLVARKLERRLVSLSLFLLKRGQSILHYKLRLLRIDEIVQELQGERERLGLPALRSLEHLPELIGSTRCLADCIRTLGDKIEVSGGVGHDGSPDGGVA